VGDYFTQFACALDLGAAERAQAALALLDDIREAEAESDDEALYGFDAEIDVAHPGQLFITDGGGSGEPEHVIKFVLRCAAAFDLEGRWGFTWALTCSRPRVDGFGGGPQLLDLTQRKSLDRIDCDHWLAGELADDDPSGGSAPASTTADPSGPPLAGRSVSGNEL